MRERQLAKTPCNIESNRKDQENDIKTKKFHNRKEEKRQKAERRQLIHDTLKPIAKEVEMLEARISELEKTQEEVEILLAEPGIFSDKKKSIPVLTQYKAVKKELEASLKKWEETHQRLEAAKKELGDGL